MTESQEADLIRAAQRGMENAYCPVTGFSVGAAVLTVNGNTYQGCNVQSVISGLGVARYRT